MTSVDRTVYPRFGRMVPGRELTDAFTPTDAEAEWAHSRTQDPEHLLALAVLLKSYQRLGYFPKAEDVPSVVVRHVRGCLGLGPEVEFGPTAERTGKRHREFVRAKMKVTYDSARVREVAEQAIRKAAQAKDNPADLINVALEELVRARCELPGYTTLDAMAASVRTEVKTAVYQMVAGRIGPVARLQLGRLYVVDPVTRRSGFDRLKDVAKSASLGKFRLRLDLLAEIDALGPTGEWLDGVPPGKIAHFAGEARVTDVADLRKIQDEGKRLTLLDRHYRSHRSALFTLVDAIELESTSAERSVVDAVSYLRELRNAKASYVPERMEAGRLNEDGEAETVTVTVAVDVDAFASAAWRKILRDKDHPGMLVRRHLEVCVFSYLAAELRSGDIAVAGSDSYANLHDQLMTWEECRPLADAFCAQASIPSDPAALTAHYRSLLASTATRVDAGYPSNTDLVLEGDRPVLRRRKGLDRRPEALRLEGAIHERLPQRALLDILTRTAYLLGWHHHFGPAPGSDPKIRDALARYVLTAFAYGTLLGPAQVAAHMRGQVSVHELTLAGNKHTTAAKIEKASAAVINAFSRLDVTAMWGDGKTAAADGSQIDTWEDNLLAETSVRYGGYGGIAYRHISNTYIALFSHFIPCGVWEAVYIIEGLLKNDSDVQPDTVHADTQGQSLPVFGLAALLGFDLLPRIRNWHDLVFYRPGESARYQHIDALFGDEAVDWALIEAHWPDLLRTAISIRENRMSSVTLLRRLGNHSRKNRLYRAFRELGRAIRTITLLRYLSEPGLRDQIAQVTNRNEAFHGFADWLMFGGKLIGHNDPDYQEKVVKFNELIANCVMYSTACDITDAANAIAAEGEPAGLATVSPYITSTVRRFGSWTLNLTPPDHAPATRLDLEPRVLFAPSAG